MTERPAIPPRRGVPFGPQQWRFGASANLKIWLIVGHGSALLGVLIGPVDMALAALAAVALIVHGRSCWRAHADRAHRAAIVSLSWHGQDLFRLGFQARPAMMARLLRGAYVHPALIVARFEAITGPVRRAPRCTLIVASDSTGAPELRRLRVVVGVMAHPPPEH